MKRLTIALCAALACAPSLAGAASPRGLPPFGKDKPIPVPSITRKTLPNGLQVWVVPRTGLPRVDYVLAVRGAGYAADDATLPGFANILAGLLNEGTARRDSRAVAEAAQSYGGTVGGGANNDGITVSANALASHAGPMMQLLAEVVRTPAFPPNEVKLAKTNALESLKAQEAQPGFRAERALSRAIYGTHPYGHTTPTEASIKAVGEAALIEAHARRFRPDRSLLVIAGRIDSASALKLAAEAFGDWKAAGEALPETPAAPGAAEPVRLLVERPGSVQSTLRLGSPGPAASAGDYVPLRLASTILGGSFSSRINTRLREEKGYTYGATAGARIYRDGGGIVGGADVRNEVTGAALADTMKEYRRLGTQAVPAAEMTMNKRYMAGSYLVSNQMQQAVAGTLAANWLVGLPAEFLGQFVPKIQKVTPDQVRAMGKKYFAPERQAIVVVGDSKAVGAQLKQFGDFTVQDK